MTRKEYAELSDEYFTQFVGLHKVEEIKLSDITNFQVVARGAKDLDHLYDLCQTFALKYGLKESTVIDLLFMR
jgi:hypothetical protein